MSLCPCPPHSITTDRLCCAAPETDHHSEPQAKGNTEGQRQKALDDNPDIVKPKTVGIKVGKLIQEKRNEMEPKMTRDQLAKKCNTTSNILGQYEAGSAQPDQKILDALERALNVKLRGAQIGEPKFKPKPKK